MSYNLTQEELNEMRDWSAKAEQLVRLGMLPVSQLPYIKRALKLVQSDAFLPLIIRKPFYRFVEELFELGLGEPGIYRLIRNKVAANRNDAVINRYMPEETDMAEEKVGTVPQQPKWLKGKKLVRPNPYDDKGATANKTETGDLARTLSHDVEVHEDCKETDIKTGYVKPQPKWLKGSKLTRSNPYGDKESVRNKTKTAEIADDANSTVKVTEGTMEYKHKSPTKKERVQAKKDFIAGLWKKKEEKAVAIDPKVTGVKEERDADERAGDREDRTFKKKVKEHEAKHPLKTTTLPDGRKVKVSSEGFVAKFGDMLRAKDVKVSDIKKGEKIVTHAPRAIPLGTRKGGIKQPKDFVLGKERTHNEETRRASDNPLNRAWNKTNPTTKLGGIIKAHKDFDGRQTPAPKTEKPMPKGKAEQLKLNMELVMSGEVLDEDVNYRKTPQGMLQTLSNMVKIKKRHGGKVSVNDRKIASKARNELRRRKYFGNTTNSITSSFDPAYLELADVLAEENVFLSEEHLEELKNVLGSYLKKATADYDRRFDDESVKSYKRGKGFRFDRDDIDADKARKLDKREKGIATAKVKIKEEAEPIEELHKDTYRSYAKAALIDRDDHLLNYSAHTMGGRDKSAGKSLAKVQKRTKGIEHAVDRLHSPKPDVHEKPQAKKERKVRPSKASWFKDAADAADVKDVDTKKPVRKEEFEARFAKTLELFEVKSISELDEEMTKVFMALVQSESKSDDEYQEKVYDKIKAAKKVSDENLTPEQIRYRAEKKARAEKADSAISAAKDELAKTPKGGWSKLPKDSA